MAKPFPLVGHAIRSVWALELLIFLRTHRSPRSVGALARELRANERMVEGALRAFLASGLVVCDDRGDYAYGPASPLLEDQAAELDQAYRERPVSVINAIVASSTDSLRSFADAFRLKGDSE